MIQKELINKLKTEQVELIVKFKANEKILQLERYKILSRLLYVGKQLDRKYTIRQLAEDVDMNEETVYRIIRFNMATDYTIAQVELNKISFHNVIDLFTGFGDGIADKDTQNDLVKYIVDNNIKNKDLYKHLHINKFDKVAIIEEKEYKNAWNISRDIKYYSQKMNKCLLPFNKIPENQIDDVVKHLIATKKIIDTVLRELKK